MNHGRNGWFESSFLEGNLFHFEVTNLSRVNTSAQHVMVIRVLSHRLVTNSSGYSGDETEALRIKNYKHMDKALKALNMEIASERATHGDKPPSLVTICCILQLGVSEVRQACGAAASPLADCDDSCSSPCARIGARIFKHIIPSLKVTEASQLSTMTTLGHNAHLSRLSRRSRSSASVLLLDLN